MFIGPAQGYYHLLAKYINTGMVQQIKLNLKKTIIVQTYQNRFLISTTNHFLVLRVGTLHVHYMLFINSNDK